MMYYRLVFEDGSVGPWCIDKQLVKEWNWLFTNSKIEEKFFNKG